MRFILIGVIALVCTFSTANAQLFKRNTHYAYGTTVNTPWGPRQCPNPYCVMCWDNYGPIPGYQKVKQCHGRYCTYKIVKVATQKKVAKATAYVPTYPIVAAPQPVVLNFGPTPVEAIDLIPTVVPLNKTTVFYDFGSANGNVLKRIASRVRRAIGIERDLVLYNASKSNLLGITNASVINGDFIVDEIAFSDADVIYVHQNTPLLKRLVPIWKKKLRKGTIIVSYNHDIPDVCTTMQVYGPHRFFVHEIGGIQEQFETYRIK